MQEHEIKKLLAVMITAYPNYKPDNMKHTVDVWNDMLSEYTYQQASVALKAYIAMDTSGFAPSIGQLIAKIHDLSDEPQLNEMEAWALVSKALRNGYYGAEEEFEKLPAVVQKAVGSPANLRNWSQTDMGSVENVIQSNFLRTYRTVVERDKEYQKMPASVRLIIENAGKQNMIDELPAREIAVTDGNK